MFLLSLVLTRQRTFSTSKRVDALIPVQRRRRWHHGERGAADCRCVCACMRACERECWKPGRLQPPTGWLRASWVRAGRILQTSARTHTCTHTHVRSCTCAHVRSIRVHEPASAYVRVLIAAAGLRQDSGSDLARAAGSTSCRLTTQSASKRPTSATTLRAGTLAR